MEFFKEDRRTARHTSAGMDARGRTDESGKVEDRADTTSTGSASLTNIT
jgi:hypothetical protein